MRNWKTTLPSPVIIAIVAAASIPAHAGSLSFGNGGYSGSQSEQAAQPSFRDMVLIAHNDERRQWHVPPLTWNEGLARDARAYAQQLTRLGYLQHASMAGQADPQGENLWMGTRGAFNYGQMMDGFLSERRNYVAGALPYISRTGNWADTGHYSQIIWRTTTSVGCATASSRDFDFLVCRYWPAGNIWGKRANDADRMASAAVAMNEAGTDAPDAGRSEPYSYSFSWVSYNQP